MQTIKLLTLIVALFGSSYCSPIGGAELFPGFYRNANLQAPQKEADINKRLAVEPNPDAALKQISLQAFIGNLEQSLLQSAISVSGVNDQTQQVVPEVTPVASQAASTATTVSEVTSDSSAETETEHTISKRSTIAIVDGTTSQGTTQTTPTGSSTTTPSTPTTTTSPATAVSTTTDPNHVLLQTTKKVPQQDGIPAHILIDRISVQPHNGHIPLIPTFQVQHAPTFQVQHTKVIKATVKDDNGTPETADDKTKHISITQTSIKSINVQSSKEEATPTTMKVDAAVPETSTVVDSAEESSTATSTTQTAESVSTTSGTTEAQDSTTGAQTSAPSTTTTSTAKPQEELKHAEEDLKEKVAEIEAEPVILSARV